jgi:acetylserotonin N-methyltransferase
MTQDLTVPSPNKVLDLLEAFRRSKTMFAAVSLGIFDCLEQAPASTNVLSAKLSCDLAALSTLLHSCVTLGLLRRDGETFSNTPEASTYLCSSSPRQMTGYINYSNRVMWAMWANLEDAIRQGSNRWKQTYGTEGPIFSNFFKTPEAMNEFLMGMHGFGMITSPQVVQNFDLSRFRHLCDLGGATGHLSIAACLRWTQLRATVFDLPHALELANQMTREYGLVDRISIVGGDFFSDPLPPADLYFLGRILHDWSIDKIRLLLTRIYEALPSGGGLLIGEKIIEEDRSGPRWALMQSLNMLVCTEGTERTLTEYAELLHEAGFSEVVGARNSVPLDAVLAIKE